MSIRAFSGTQWRARSGRVGILGGYVPITTWTPASPGNLFAWYDAALGVFSDAGTTPVTNGGTVRQWNDQSGNGNNLSQATAGNRPTYSVAGGVNSHPMVTFTESSGTVLTSPQTINLSGTSALSICVVFEYTGFSSNNRIISILNSGDSVDFATLTSATPLFLDASVQISSYRNGAAPLPPSTGAISTWYDIETIYDGANATMYMSNSAGAPVSSTGSWGSADGIAVGGLYTGGTSQMFTGNICEALFYSIALSSTDRSNLRSYLLSKYGF